MSLIFFLKIYFHSIVKHFYYYLAPYFILCLLFNSTFLVEILDSQSRICFQLIASCFRQVDCKCMWLLKKIYSYLESPLEFDYTHFSRNMLYSLQSYKFLYLFKHVRGLWTSMNKNSPLHYCICVNMITRSWVQQGAQTP